MTAATQPVDLERAIRDGLDALAGGTCTQAEFLRLMQERARSEPDGSWEVLSQLDQYYRRGKIKAEVFHALKTQLAGSALGVRDAVPLPAGARDAVPIPTGVRDAISPAPSAAGPGMTSPNLAARGAAALGTTAPSMAARSAVPPQPPPDALLQAAAKPAKGPEGSREPKVGDLLRGRYRLEAVVHRGAIATIYAALDEHRPPPADAQRIALKVFRSAVASRPELLDELRRQFRALQSLSHPNILRVHEFDRDGAIVFCTMELLRGMPLNRLLDTREQVPLERPQALGVISQVGAALQCAHLHGITHGDLRPQDVFMTDDGEVRVLGFAAREPGDVRDDVFALACLAYLLLCGEPAYPQQAPPGAAVAPRRPANFKASHWRILREGLRREPENRPHDVQKWLEPLDLDGRGKRQSTFANQSVDWSVAALIVIAAVASVGGYWLINNYDLSPRDAGSARPVNGDARAAANAPGSPAPDRPAGEPVKETPARHSSVGTETSRGNPAPAAGTASTGPSRVELAADTIDLPLDAQSAEVTVRRRGSLRGEVGFLWWTESGTAKPGTDFTPVTPQIAHIAEGSTAVSLRIPLINSTRTQPKSFYVMIDESEGGGATLGGRTLTMITLAPTG